MAGQRYPVAGKSVLITGAARGIGAEAAKQIAARGGRVALVGLEPEELERTAAECGSDALWFEVDVRHQDELERAIEETTERFGGIDVVVANAGVGAGSLVRHSGEDALEFVMDINLFGAVRTLRLSLPHVLERRGYMLAVASMAAIGQPPGMAAYSASKAGLEAFANSLRIEMRPHGVDVGVAYFRGSTPRWSAAATAGVSSPRCAGRCAGRWPRPIRRRPPARLSFAGSSGGPAG